jgi:hypothetical protein
MHFKRIDTLLSKDSSGNERKRPLIDNNIFHLLQIDYTEYSNHKSIKYKECVDLVTLVFYDETHLAGNCLLTAGTLKLLAAAFPTLARGLNANALADEAAIASKTIFFMANILSRIYSMILWGNCGLSIMPLHESHAVCVWYLP